MIDKFMGYNANLRCSESEFSDMKNMTSDFFPVLSPRKKRGVVSTPDNPQGIISKDALIYVDGSNIKFNEYTIDLGLSTNASMCPKKLISMGAYLIVWPDMKYLNTADITDKGSLNSAFCKGNVEYSMCKLDGSDLTVTASGTAPSSPANKSYWMDTSGDKATLNVWSETASMWTQVATTYVKIEASGIDSYFNVGDGVQISGVTIEQLKDLNSTMVIQGKGTNYIIVIGIIGTLLAAQQGAITVKRQAPTMDYVIEANNRLWGCHYGMKDGKAVNEIYASKLGDPKNWNCFAGLSTDSYAVSLGSDGVFTGAVSYLGYPIFFKENCLHKIYGEYPANFRLQNTICRGIQKGSDRSVQIVDERLIYKSDTDICIYDGSLPTSISAELGNEHYSEAVAGSIGNKYYISLKNSDNEFEMYVYDVSLGTWHKEDHIKAMEFATKDHKLYYIDAITKNIMCMEYSSSDCSAEESDIEWYVTSGIIGFDYPDRKYLSRFNIRMKITTGTTIEVFCEYDSSGNWVSQGTITGNKTDSFTLPVIPRRCDHMRIKISGTGDCKIFSITKVLEEGSDM